MDFAGSGKATAEATWPAIFQALCDTGHGLNHLLVETKGLRDDMGLALGNVVIRLDALIDVVAKQQLTLSQLVAAMGQFRSEVNANTAELAQARAERRSG
jgi:hypothetical protein